VEDEDGDRLIYLGGGPLAALLLGVALVPLRGFTTASNFTFAFMALTILVAELGGRGAALVTALSSSLSLDFFLTEPYRRLAIADKHDVIAFLGLTACGLVAAAVGSQRGERVAALRASRAQLGLVHSGLDQLEKGVSADVGLKRVLDAARDVLPLAAAVVRDTRGNLLAATERAYGMPVPARDLEADASAARAATDRSRQPLPREGARLALVFGGRPVGWLDVWGNGKPAGAQARRTLSGVARLLAVILARADSAPAGGALQAVTPGLPEASSSE
jgi:two-component system sensor histidine kinase KdpD